MEFLAKSDILLINRFMIEQFGGNFVPPENLLKPLALDYLIEIVDSEAFGVKLYPEIHHVAGVYLFNIVHGHVFQDGNKRTGLESMLLFLKLNGLTLNASDSEMIDYANEVGAGIENLDSVQLG